MSLESELAHVLQRRSNVDAVAIPSIDAVRRGADARRRHRAVILRAGIALAVVVVAVATWTLRRQDHRPVTPVVPTPVTSRLFPADTAGATFESAFGAGAIADIPGFPRTIAIQLWSLNGVPVLGVKSDPYGGGGGNGVHEQVEVAGWQTAGLWTSGDGSLSLTLNTGDNTGYTVVSRSLTRDELLAIGPTVKPRSDRLGVTIDPSVLPPGWTATADEELTIDASILFSFRRTTDPPMALEVTIRSQSQAGRDFDRLGRPEPAHGSINGEPVDIYDSTFGPQIVWMPEAGIEVSVGARASINERQSIALTVASSIRAVDEQTWRAILSTRDTATDGTTVTTSNAPPDSISESTADSVAPPCKVMTIPQRGECALVDWDAISTNGSTIALDYYVDDPGCSLGLSRVEATETDETVRLRVIVGFAGGAPFGECPNHLTTRSTTVELDAPLGDRLLLGCRPSGSAVIRGKPDHPEPRNDRMNCGVPAS